MLIHCDQRATTKTGPFRPKAGANMGVTFHLAATARQHGGGERKADQDEGRKAHGGCQKERDREKPGKGQKNHDDKHARDEKAPDNENYGQT